MAFDVTDLCIAAVKVIKAHKFKDGRGFFSEVYTRKGLAEAGLDIDFVQDNQSFSAEKGTLRGLHFQVPPFAQDKLVRVVRGAILDVAVDLRVGSPTYGKHASAAISADDWNQIFVPIGFAHGFITLEPNTEVIYKVSNYYSPEHDKGVLWSDPDLAIEWPQTDSVLLSEKDRHWPTFQNIPDVFRYEAPR
jgi:dTDP-4-dehydrorhamnose 3,5-epimerase